MGQLTTDNVDDIIRSTLRIYFDDILKRLQNLELMLRQDLALDQNQKGNSGTNEDRVGRILQIVEIQNTEIDLLKKLVEEVGRKIYEIDEKLNAYIVRR